MTGVSVADRTRTAPRPAPGSLRRLLAGAALAAACLVAGPAAARDEAPDLRLLRVSAAGQEIEPALEAFLLDGVLYLPVVRLAELVERPFSLSADGRTLRMEGPGGAETLVDLTPDGSVWPGGGAACLPLDRVEEVFAVDLEADLGRDLLILSPAGATPLPVVERLRREAGWRRLPERDPAPPPAVTIEPPWAAWALAMGDVVFTARSGSDGARSVDYNALVIGEAAWLTHELYVSGGDGRPPDDIRLTSGRRDYDGGVFGWPSLHQAAAGDVYGHPTPLVGRAPLGRGVSLTGRPLLQPTDFDVTLVEGDALPGWDAELYRNGELLAVQRIGPDGRYRFEDAPLTVGRNALLVRLYGPQGQTREDLRTITVGVDTPPPGVVRWDAFLNQPDRRLFDALLDRTPRYDGAAGAIQMEVGLGRALSAGAFAARGPVSSRRGSGFDTYLGLVVRSTLGPAALETVAATREGGGWAWRAAALAGIGPATLTLRHEEYPGGYRSPEAELGASPLRRSSRARVSAPLSILGPGLGSLGLAVDWYDLAGGQQELAARINWRVDLRGVHFDHGIEHREVRRADAIGTDRTLYVGAAALTRGPLGARAAVRHALSGGAGLESYDASLQYRVSDDVVASAGLFRDQLNGRTGGNLGLSRDLGFAFLTLAGAWDEEGEYTIGAGLTFSFGFPAEGAPRLSSRPGARLGALEPFVYLDRAGDGRYQAGVDEPLADVQLLVNGYPAPSARTDARGRAWLAGAAPGQPVSLGVDLASLPDAFLVPARPDPRVRARPGRAIAIDVPIVETGEISGRVELQDADSRAPVRGFRLELVDEGGAVAATTVSMLDGVWIFEGVPPGRWTVRSSPGQDVAGALAAPLLIATGLGPNGLVEGIDIRIDARTGRTTYALPTDHARVPAEEGLQP